MSVIVSNRSTVDGTQGFDRLASVLHGISFRELDDRSRQTLQIIWLDLMEVRGQQRIAGRRRRLIQRIEVRREIAIDADRLCEVGGSGQGAQILSPSLGGRGLYR